MDTVAFETSVIERFATRADWDAEATDLLRTMLDRWSLSPGDAFAGGEAGAVIAVTTAGGDSAVLKLGFPHREAVWEAVGLRAWGPDLAPRVLRQDPWTWALLLERLEPGIPLSKADLPVEEGLRVACELYRELAAAPVPAGVVTLADVVTENLRNVDARPAADRDTLERLGVAELVAGGLAMLRDLAERDTASSFLHGDFNPGNVVRSGDRWKTIDPKPMAGDPEFDLFPLVEQLGSPFQGADPVGEIGDRLITAARIVGCDPERTAQWCFAHCALNIAWLVEDGDLTAAADTAHELRVWETVLNRR